MCIFCRISVTTRRLQQPLEIALSFPSPADDHADKPLNLHEYLIPRPASTFFWRYVGHSMERAGIQYHALLIIDRSLDAREHDIVVAYHQDEYVVRRLQKRNGRYRLVSEPLEGKSIALSVNENTRIWGVVTHAINTYRTGSIRSDRYGDVSDGQG